MLWEDRADHRKLEYDIQRSPLKPITSLSTPARFSPVDPNHVPRRPIPDLSSHLRPCLNYSGSPNVRTA
jgi:hypothetical protein